MGFSTSNKIVKELKPFIQAGLNIPKTSVWQVSTPKRGQQVLRLLARANAEVFLSGIKATIFLTYN